MTDLDDRRRGCLIGLAVGDALGAAVEFRPPGSFEPVAGYRAGGPHVRDRLGKDTGSLTLSEASGLIDDLGAGTAVVASAGRPVTPDPAWPEGLAAVVNAPARTDGWNPWFSEWPNDVNHYRYELETTDQANVLLRAFAAVRAKGLRVRLSPSPEPRSLGWASTLPEGNGTAVVLSVGDQGRVDEWHARLPGGTFGRMEF